MSAAVRQPDEWLVQAHHPDLLRQPEPRPGRAACERLQMALVWNVFRTLSLVEPSFWLRGLHARLFGFDDRYRAPGALDVRFWVPAPSREPGDAVVVDVLLESPQIVWALETVYARDIIVTARDVEGPDPLLRTIDAALALAGGRDVFVALVTSGDSAAPIGTRLVRRYAAAPDLLRSRLPALRDAVRMPRIGRGTWGTLATVVAEAARTPAVDRPERLALYRCLDWLAAAGIHPGE